MLLNEIDNGSHPVEVGLADAFYVSLRIPGGMYMYIHYVCDCLCVCVCVCVCDNYMYTYIQCTCMYMYMCMCTCIACMGKCVYTGFLVRIYQYHQVSLNILTNLNNSAYILTPVPSKSLTSIMIISMLPAYFCISMLPACVLCMHAACLGVMLGLGVHVSVLCRLCVSCQL